MGNRGVLHDGEGQIKRDWQVKRWLLCRLAFRGRQRVIMAAGRYTELFFLDEATGLAAGHRPCYECRRGSFQSFVDAWSRSNISMRRPNAQAIDEQLHRERIGPDRCKRTFRAALAGLPNGVIVTGIDGSELPHLLCDGRLLVWSPGGYTASLSATGRGEVTVLTPWS